MMVCPYCGNTETRVLAARDRRPDDQMPSKDYRWRRRQCSHCQQRFSTREMHHPAPPDTRI